MCPIYMEFKKWIRNRNPNLQSQAASLHRRQQSLRASRPRKRPAASRRKATPASGWLMHFLKILG